MNPLHPIMQQALRPFMPKPRSRCLFVGRPADGRETFHYCLADVPLVCEIYWEREEKQTWTEPGWPATAELESADCGGLNIIAILSDDQIAEIETAFLEQAA